MLTQVFPLLIEKCSVEEQSHLVWQYMCTVPTILLEEFLPWTTRYLSSDEKLDVQHCIKLIVPNERLLQEVYPNLKLSSNVVKYLKLIMNSTGNHFLDSAREFFAGCQQHIWKEASTSNWTIQ